MNMNYIQSGRAPARLLMAVCLMAQMALISAYAGDSVDNRGQLTASDYKFAKKAACAGITEVDLGRLAMQKSASSAVQQFGEHMVREHSKANQDLQMIASKAGATLPIQPGEDEQIQIDRLTNLTSPEFDKEYVAFMVKSHKLVEKEFKHASENADNADLKAFAAATLAVVQSHLKMAEDLEQSLRVTASR